MSKPTKIGIFGAGQLGRMLAHSGFELGLDVFLYDSAPNPSASIFRNLTTANFDDIGALKKFASQCDALTYEFENIPMDALRSVQTKVPIFPSLDLLKISQDRLLEKDELNRLGIETAPYRTVDSTEDLRVASEKLSFPFILKTRRMGYDGKGQQVISSSKDCEAISQQLGSNEDDASLIAEGMVPFETELSLISARSKKGEVAFYPLVQNHHEQGILRWSKPMANHPLQSAAEAYAQKILASCDYVGVLVIEFFVVGTQLIANEIAPRVHNSGHWTIEGSITSQFENHMRAVSGLPLGSTETRGYPLMLNLIGEMKNIDQHIEDPMIKVHDYGKSARSGRKVGHLTGLYSTEHLRDSALISHNKLL